MNVYELNMDGLVGPSHHYAGLAPGNIASETHALTIANPAAAAHQGIAKMRQLHQLGLKQAVLPPHLRPNLQLLYDLGFTGTPAEQVKKAKAANPNLLGACYSASSMWTANAATVSSSLDTHDQRVHFTAANLVSNLHRHQEAVFSTKILKQLFSNPAHFKHHQALPGTITLGDEGAANHNRICKAHHEPGINLFVYGKKSLPANNKYPAPIRYPARQTLEASQTIARLHQLNTDRLLFANQNPAVIDQGVFHNDVIAVANESVLLIHEEAFLNQQEILAKLETMADYPLHIIEVMKQHISVADAVSSYLFNSQLITLPSKKMALITPLDCQQVPHVKAFIDELLADMNNPISNVHYLDLKQSMQNGGGPACLRLRVPLTEIELAAMHQGVIVTNELLDSLDNWVDMHYRTRLQADDLDDPNLIDECFTALDALSRLLGLGNIYSFQR